MKILFLSFALTCFLFSTKRDASCEPQQFPLTIANLASLQSADPLDCNEFIAKAMDEEQYEGDTSVMKPERGSRRELLCDQQFPLTIANLASLQSADPLDCNEFIAKAMDEEQYEGDTSVMKPERGSRRELLCEQQGRILFLIHQGEQKKALEIYRQHFLAEGSHDFDLLHQMGLKILDYGFRLKDPECQLLALFGAAISAHEEAYYILEESLKSPYPAIQMVALGALASFQNDSADLAIIRSLGSSTLEVRYEAVNQLCKKKHLSAPFQAESLMYKTPKAFLSIYPPLFAMMDDPHSTRILRKLLNQPSPKVRLNVLLSIAEQKRDDLTPQVRQLSSQAQIALQEACAYAFGVLKDEESTERLKKLSQSQHSSLALAADLALYKLGHEDAVKRVEEKAKKEELFAIYALGSIPERPKALLDLLRSPNLQVRLNASIALLQQRHPLPQELIQEWVIRDEKDLGFTVCKSPGKTLKAWKATPSASRLMKDDLEVYMEHLKLKKSFLKALREISTPRFISLAHQIFNRGQNDLVSYTVELLEEIGSKEAVDCLKKHQQQLGAPLVRHYCNLALFRMQEEGPWSNQLRNWVKTQSKTQLIRFKPFKPWELGNHPCTLTPEESSQLLIDTFETFASMQDALGIEILIEAMADGHEKNRYALAGLLLRAAQ